jgi:hypothetical protein
LNLQDPNQLLQGRGEEGFTVALLKRNHPRLRMGPRHMKEKMYGLTKDVAVRVGRSQGGRRTQSPWVVIFERRRVMQHCRIDQIQKAHDGR